MRNNNWLTSDLQQRGLFAVRTTSSRRRARRHLVTLYCAVTLLALVLLLSGCTTPPSRPCEMLPLPMPPALSEPLPSVSYSEQWRKLVEKSRLRLIDTQTTPKP